MDQCNCARKWLVLHTDGCVNQLADQFLTGVLQRLAIDAKYGIMLHLRARNPLGISIRSVHKMGIHSATCAAYLLAGKKSHRELRLHIRLCDVHAACCEQTAVGSPCGTPPKPIKDSEKIELTILGVYFSTSMDSQGASRYFIPLLSEKSHFTRRKIELTSLFALSVHPMYAHNGQSEVQSHYPSCLFLFKIRAATRYNCPQYCRYAGARSRELARSPWLHVYALAAARYSYASRWLVRADRAVHISCQSRFSFDHGLL
jgi:hypothetical protein